MPSPRPSSARYARFAADEAPGRSALYEEWAAGVAGDAGAVRILARIPETHRQPPLVFAVTRLLGAPEAGYASWASWLADNADAVVAEASRRSVQTNEPQRCAALLPALSGVDGPIALLELGASAGLCLFPDRYSYRYRGGRDLDPRGGPSTVVLACDVSGDPPLRLPEIVWRAGIDLAPLDAADPADRRFLTTLVWPGEDGPSGTDRGGTGHRGRRAAAAHRGRRIRPRRAPRRRRPRSRGRDARRDDAGVLPHIPRAGRERLIAAVRALDAVWISIDPPGLHDAWRPAVDRGDVGRVRPRPRRCSARRRRPARRFRGVARGVEPGRR